VVRATINEQISDAEWDNADMSKMATNLIENVLIPKDEEDEGFVATGRCRSYPPRQHERV
jgi:hypothetical protein